MGAGRRRLWWTHCRARKDMVMWTHKCDNIVISVEKGSSCNYCGKSEEEHGRLQSEGSERRILSS